MRIQRIQWAGIMLECEGEVLMIDPIYDSYQSSFFGQPLEELYELS